MAAKDFYTNPTTGDIELQDGDFRIGYSDNTHVSDILISNPGQWKQEPLIGVGIVQYLKSPGGLKSLNDFERNVRVQLKLDNMIIKSFKLDDMKSMKITATRND